MPNPDIPKENEIFGQDSVENWITVFQNVINCGLQEAQETGKIQTDALLHIYGLFSTNYVLGDDVKPQSFDLLKAEIKKAVSLLRNINFDAEATFRLEGLFDKSAGLKPVENIKEARERVKSDLRLKEQHSQLIQENIVSNCIHDFTGVISTLIAAKKAEDIPRTTEDLLDKVLSQLPDLQKLQPEQCNSLKRCVSSCVDHLQRLKYNRGIISVLKGLFGRLEKMNNIN